MTSSFPDDVSWQCEFLHAFRGIGVERHAVDFPDAVALVQVLLVHHLVLGQVVQSPLRTRLQCVRVLKGLILNMCCFS